MGRKLKRVPLDFSWPQGKTWGGYLNPFASMSVTCPGCEGTIERIVVSGRSTYFCPDCQVKLRRRPRGRRPARRSP